MAARTTPQPDPQTAETARFPHNWNKEGVCEHLTADNRCAIYHTRPDVCNIETMHRKYYSHVTQEQYYNLSGWACKVLQKEAELGHQIPDSDIEFRNELIRNGRS
jgi:Fe-S-cluster containining protein